MNVLNTVYLFGVTLAGKNETAKILLPTEKYHHLSTGDKIKQYFKNPPSELEKNLDELEKGTNGPLVEDKTMEKILLYAIDEDIKLGKYTPEKQFLLLDGFPRTIGQLKTLRKEEELSFAEEEPKYIFESLAFIHVVVGKYKSEAEPILLKRLEKRIREEKRPDDELEKTKAKIKDFYENIIRTGERIWTTRMIPREQIYAVQNTGTLDELKNKIEITHEKIMKKYEHLII